MVRAQVRGGDTCSGWHIRNAVSKTLSLYRLEWRETPLENN